MDQVKPRDLHRSIIRMVCIITTAKPRSISHPMSVAKLGDGGLCFSHHRGVVDNIVAGDRPLPDIRYARRSKRGRARGGLDHDQLRSVRYTNQTWWDSQRTAMNRLAAMNDYDLRLYDWASQQWRQVLETHWREHYVPGALPSPLPDLPCSGPGVRCWKSGPPKKDAAVAERRRVR